MAGSHDDFELMRIKKFASNYLDKSMAIEGVRILAIPQETVSGDFHVVIRSEDSIYVMVADGVGHGLSAVIPGLRFPSMFVELANKGHSILTIASKLNDELFRYDHKGYFIAVTLVQINEQAGTIDVLNCGNPAALLVGKNGQILHTFKSSSLACGIVKNDNYELLTEHIKYNEQASLYIFTDGIQDTLIQAGMCKDNIEHELLYKNPFDSCFNTLCEAVKKAQSDKKIDDITLVEIALKPRVKSVEETRHLPQRKAITLTENNIKELLLGTSILCIDSDATSRLTISQDLSKYVGNIELCETVDKAIMLYHQHKPNLIIIELRLLLKYQAELNSILPKHSAGIPIIISCEPSNVLVAEQLLSLPIMRYLRKPIITDELLSLVGECMQMSEQQEKWRSKSSVFLGSSLAMTITDSNKRIIRVNDAFCKITGYTRDEVINCNPRLLSSGKHDVAFYKKIWHSIESEGYWSGEIWNKRKHGDLFLEWITINAIKNEYDGTVSYCSVFADITERQAVDAAIKQLSDYDHLTQLPNRGLFQAKLNQKIEHVDKERHGLAILFLDLDNFKEINEMLGHQYGDLVLKETAMRLSQCIRDTDLIARFGGDEFTICISPYDISSVYDITKKIMSEIATKPFHIQDEAFYLSMSIGVAFYPDHGEEVSSLFKHADQAMYYAKEQGRNRIKFFTPSMESSAIEKRRLIHDLRLAIKNKEFELFYQPIVELQTNAVYKAEALIRWHHPEKGLVPPDSFIPIAEDTGLINEIGNWVFEQASYQAMRWRTRIHEHFQISINKSPKQFGKNKTNHQHWIDYLAIEKSPAACIAIEITEGVMMGSKETITTELFSFRDKGIQVSLDDFGTGYSSLAYLRKFDIDYIKIDHQFVQHLETNPDDQALCQAIIAMAHALDIKVIAEGIETVGQKEFLLNSGCDYGQGYLFSKPVNVSQFETLINIQDSTMSVH